MTYTVIAYATPSHKPLAKRLEKCVADLGLPFILYDDTWLKQTPYYLENKDILDAPRGAGYWAWKPYIMLDALRHYDKVLYCDASVHFDAFDEVHSFMKLYEFATVGTTYINRDWTKRDCFRVMDCDTEKYWSANHVWAGVVLASREYREILAYWLEFCMNRKAVTDDPSPDNFPSFVDHRHDQSILSNTVAKFGLPCPNVLCFID